MENNQPTTVVVVQSKKSMGLALLLTFLFGPLGMFYSTVAGAIVMMILAPIIGIVTLGMGLVVIWPIQLIWSGIAVSSHNEKVDASTKQPAANKTVSSTVVDETPKMQTKDDIKYYNEANQLSDEKINEMLANRGELNEEFVEALKFVNTERFLKKEEDEGRKAAYNNALKLDAVERKNRIDSPSLYSELSISALKYIQRCGECGIEPNTNGFLVTFENGYIAPETPSERAERERAELEQAELDRKQAEIKQRQDKEAAETAAKYKRAAMIILSIAALLCVLIGVYIKLLQPNNEYNKVIVMIDARYANFDTTATFESQQTELEILKKFYSDLSVDLPIIKKVERSLYLSAQIEAIDNQLNDVRKKIEEAEVEKARLAEEDRKKAAADAKIAKQKAEAAAAAKRLEAERIAKQKAEAEAEAKKELAEAEAKERAEALAAKRREVTTAKANSYNSNTNRKSSTTSNLQKNTPVTSTVFDEDAYIKMGRPANLVIPNSYTSIGRKACESQLNLTSVVIPNTITSIGERAFKGCVLLRSITIPQSVTSIGGDAFNNCANLESFTWLNTNFEVPRSYFSGCPNLKKINGK